MQLSIRLRNRTINLPSAAALGCAAGLILVVCLRRFVQILGPGQDVRTTGATLFLAGVGLGTWFISFWGVKVGRRSLLIPVGVLTTLLVTVVGQHLAPTMSLVAAGVGPVRSSWFWDALICGIVGVILELVPMFGIAALLAALARQQRSQFTCTGSKLVTSVVATIGGLLGLLLADGWLLAYEGTLPTIAIALILLVVVGLSEVQESRFGLHGCLVFLSVAGILVYCLGIGLGGDYLYGQPDGVQSKPELEFFRVGASADVRVRRNGPNRSLEINGVPVVGSGGSLAGEFALACLPRLLRPEARRVLVVGFGSGTASGASLLFSHTQVVCAENEPAIVSAARAFRQVNFQPYPSKMFSIVPQTGKSAARAKDCRFGLVLLDYGDPRLPGVPYLLSAQFYTSVKHSLSADGIVAQRLVLDSFRPEGLSLMARTVSRGFRHSALARISDSEAMWVMSDSPLLDSSNTVQSAQSLVDGLPALGEALQRNFRTTNVSRLLLEHLWLDEDGVRRLARCDGERRVIAAWSLASSLARQRWDKNEEKETCKRLIISSASVDAFTNTFVRCRCSWRDAIVFHSIASVFMEYDYPGNALKLVAQGLLVDPEQPDLLVDKLLWSRERSQAIIDKAVQRIAKGSIGAAARVGEGLWASKKYHGAAAVFNSLTQLSPQSATLWYGLGMNLEATGDGDRARKCFEQAARLDPANSLVGQAHAELNY